MADHLDLLQGMTRADDRSGSLALAALLLPAAAFLLLALVAPLRRAGPARAPYCPILFAAGALAWPRSGRWRSRAHGRLQPSAMLWDMAARARPGRSPPSASSPTPTPR